MFKNVFASGFLVRTAHVILTWVITLILFLHDTGKSATLVGSSLHYSSMSNVLFESVVYCGKLIVMFNSKVISCPLW